MVRRRTGGRVKDRTAGAKGEGCPRVGAVTDRLAEQVRRLGPLAQLGCVQGLAVAVRAQDVLPVTVPVDEELYAGPGTQLPEEGVKALVLRGVGRRLATVGLGAGVGGCTTRVRIPAELPVTVDVPSEARLVGRRGGRGVAALAPKAVGDLGVDEAVRVDEWEDEEVVFVKDGGSDVISCGVAVGELQGDVLEDLCSKG